MFEKKYDDYRAIFEEFLKDELVLSFVPQPLKDSILYAMRGKGKRIRPVLFLSICSLFSSIKKEHLLFALAIELLHNYSLVHDDLPCMDNDDLRRGMPSCHKKFDEATALLAGDGLLTLAFNTISNTDFASTPYLR